MTSNLPISRLRNSLAIAFLRLKLDDANNKARFIACQQTILKAECTFIQTFIRHAFEFKRYRHNVFAAGFNTLHEGFFTAESPSL